MTSMANSNLLPEAMKSPVLSLLIGSWTSFAICVLVYVYPLLGKNLFNICMLCSFSEYAVQSLGYLALNYKHSTLPRVFRSPLGVFGAYYVIAVSLLAVISIVFFQNDNGYAIIVVLFLVFIYSIYYHLVAKNTQTLSDSEKSVKVLFSVHASEDKSRSVKSVDNSRVASSSKHD